MSIQIKEGVRLHIFPTQKFKTVHIRFFFKEALELEALSSRSLLSNIMDISTKKYPTQKKLGEALSDLYGAYFNTAASRLGQANVFEFNFVFPNNKFLPAGEDMREKNLDLIEEVLFNPVAEKEAFEEKIFNREKENLLEEYDSISDNKQLFAALRLNQLYYSEPVYQIPSIGRRREIEAITPQSLYDSYQRMIEDNQVDILVMGDVSEEEILADIQKLPFDDRSDKVQEILYVPEHKEDLVVSSDIQDVQQAKFNLAYKTNIYYLQEDYFPGIVFNGLFGGFPHSKLFMNVREKESLAYYASSSLASMTGKLTVQTGIDAATKNKTNRIIQDQLKALQDGDFTDDDFHQTIMGLTNNRYQSEDSPGAYLKRAYHDILVQSELMSLDQWLDRLEEVSREEVIRVAQETQLKATYLLQGAGK